MRYKTMVLELLQDQCPTLHRRLQRERMMLKAVEAYAEVLKTSHDAWSEHLRQAKPHRDPTQIASEALELALAGLKADLPSESAASADRDQTLSLEAAMTFIRSHTPPA
jgi:hypothetical protein